MIPAAMALLLAPPENDVEVTPAELSCCSSCLRDRDDIPAALCLRPRWHRDDALAEDDAAARPWAGEEAENRRDP